MTQFLKFQQWKSCQKLTLHQFRFNDHAHQSVTRLDDNEEFEVDNFVAFIEVGKKCVASIRYFNNDKIHVTLSCTEYNEGKMSVMYFVEKEIKNLIAIYYS